MLRIVIVGIHTGIGKTIASAILCEALQADYWKPVQAGILNETDSDIVRQLVSNPVTVIHKEAFQLTQLMSPHAAARIDGVNIDLERIKIPETKNHLIIETAGGLMSPLNDRQTNLDLVLHLRFPVIVVTQNYLGSINHTLLTVSTLKTSNVKISGILFNGPENSETETYILNYSELPCIGRMNYYNELDKAAIEMGAKKLRKRLDVLLGEQHQAKYNS